MSLSDISSLMRDIAPVLKEYTAAEMKPVVDRLAALEKRSTFDGKAFGEEIAAAVRGHVERKLAPILDRLERVEQRFDRLDTRIDAVALRGVSAVIDENSIVARAIEGIEPYIDERVRESVAAIPAPTIDDVRPIIESEVAAAVARLKQAKPASRNVASMHINRKGALLATMDDGWLENLGPVVEHHASAFSFEDVIADSVRLLPRPETYGPC
jgi:hypothetical protein